MCEYNCQELEVDIDNLQMAEAAHLASVIERMCPASERLTSPYM